MTASCLVSRSPHSSTKKIKTHIARLARALDRNADPVGFAAGDADALVTKLPDDQEWLEQMFAALIARRDVEALACELGMPALQGVSLILLYVVIGGAYQAVAYLISLAILRAGARPLESAILTVSGKAKKSLIRQATNDLDLFIDFSTLISFEIALQRNYARASDSCERMIIYVFGVCYVSNNASGTHTAFTHQESALNR